jgi:hypothetical protein
MSQPISLCPECRDTLRRLLRLAKGKRLDHDGKGFEYFEQAVESGFVCSTVWHRAVEFQPLWTSNSERHWAPLQYLGGRNEFEDWEWQVVFWDGATGANESLSFRLLRITGDDDTPHLSYRGLAVHVS